MSKRDFWTGVFIYFLSAETVATGLSLIADSAQVFWVSQPLVVVSVVAVIALMGGSQNKDKDD